MLNYVPQIYPNRIILFKASDRNSDEGLKNLTLGWDELSSKSVEIVTIPGDHYTRLAKPHVQSLQEQLKYYIEQF